MRPFRSREDAYIALLLPIAIGAVGWAIYELPIERVDWRLGGLTVVTVFFSSFLRIQLPRTKIHVTTSDAAIILSFILYGAEIAIILSFLETAFTTFNFRLKGGTIRYKTISVNILVAVVSIFVSTLVTQATFGPAPAVVESGDMTRFILLLSMMGFMQFLLNSSLVSLFFAVKNDKSVVSVWTEYCLNALVMYLSSAVLAGFTTMAIQQINLYLFAAVCVFFATVYFTYRRYIDDIKRTSAVAEQAERERAEQAELHVQELEHFVQRLQHAAYHDSLTELPNRNFFVDKLDELLRNSIGASGLRFAVLYLDLNRFKTINDSMGHTAGDDLIRSVAKRLTSIAGEGYIVGRFSGDEFAVIVPEMTQYRDALDLADKIGACLAEPFLIEDRRVFTSASIGIAFGNGGYQRGEDILRDSDIAMYKAKDAKQRYLVFDADMHTRAVHLMQIETDLRFAIEREEFELFYQPIVKLDDLSLAGFESLIRWNHPTRGLLAPSEFISVSESTDLIIPLTLMILKASCRQVGQWSRTRIDNPLFVSVNLSGQHFDNPDLVNHIREVLLETAFDPAYLKLEITETAVMENAEAAIAMLNSIKKLGIQVSIDDFGTGYSSLSYLHRFPIDTLKVDRSFVDSIDTSAEHSEIVRTIICLAKALNLSVVAEGIENLRQLRELITLECNYGQGYLFSRPQPAAEVEKLLADADAWQELRYSSDFGYVSMNAERAERPRPR